MDRITADSINYGLRSDKKAYINECENLYHNQILSVADTICETREDKPILFLSGPSGSGKTTTALRLENLLDSYGYNTHTISLDDYFLPVNQAEKHTLDYEAPERLDIELLHNHLERLANCEEIVLPGFDFKTQTRVHKGRLKRDKNEVVVVEGIHALNPKVIGDAANYSNNLYVSVRTKIVGKDDTILFPSKIRLSRRIVRDEKFRGKSAFQVLEQFSSVERGENLYIDPYKERADFEIDTFLGYEMSTYEPFIFESLVEASKYYDEYDKFSSIEEILHLLDSLDESFVPDNSLVREFIGGSSLKY